MTSLVEGCEIEIEPEDPLIEPIRLEYLNYSNRKFRNDACTLQRSAAVGADPELIHGQLHVFGVYVSLCTIRYCYPRVIHADCESELGFHVKPGAMEAHQRCTHAQDHLAILRHSVQK